MLTQFCLLRIEFQIMYSNLVLYSTKIFQVIISIINVTVNNIKNAINNHGPIITLSKPSYSVWLLLCILNNFYILKLYQ